MKNLSNALLCLFALVALAGCGGVSDQPDLGRVTGTVTLDGAPVSGLIVNFQPASGRAATAETDQDGKYDLVYIYGSNGAKVSPNNVSFRWPDGTENAKRLPKEYVGKTELNVDVKAGKNTFDWKMESAKK